MIYEEPVFKPGGDRYMLIEFGDELNLALNFTAHSLGDAIAQAGMKAVIESAPCFASCCCYYGPDLIGYSDLKREMESPDRHAGLVRRDRAAQPACSTSRPAISIPGPKRASRITRPRSRPRNGTPSMSPRSTA